MRMCLEESYWKNVYIEAKILTSLKALDFAYRYLNLANVSTEILL